MIMFGKRHIAQKELPFAFEIETLEAIPYTSVDPVLTGHGEVFLELKQLQKRIAKYVATHSDYREYVVDLNEFMGGGLADAKPHSHERYAFHKRRQLNKILKHFASMGVKFEF